jgi:hypothetical protein
MKSLFLDPEPQCTTNASAWLNLRTWKFAFEKQLRSDVEIISWFYVLRSTFLRSSSRILQVEPIFHSQMNLVQVGCRDHLDCLSLWCLAAAIISPIFFEHFHLICSSLVKFYHLKGFLLNTAERGNVSVTSLGIFSLPPASSTSNLFIATWTSF